MSGQMRKALNKKNYISSECNINMNSNNMDSFYKIIRRKIQKHIKLSIPIKVRKSIL